MSKRRKWGAIRVESERLFPTRCHPVRRVCEDINGQILMFHGGRRGMQDRAREATRETPNSLIMTLAEHPDIVPLRLEAPAVLDPSRKYR